MSEYMKNNQNQQNQQAERELGWEDTIEQDSSFTLLPEGDYDFQVVELERARHQGSAKLPPCNKAILHIRIEGEGGVAVIKHNLFLHSRCEGMLCAFFTAIGQRKRGEQMRMDWSKVVGAKGRAKVGIHKWVDNKGEERQSNQIKYFYDKEETPKAAVNNKEPWPEAPALPYEDGVF